MNGKTTTAAAPQPGAPRVVVYEQRLSLFDLLPVAALLVAFFVLGLWCGVALARR